MEDKGSKEDCRLLLEVIRLKKENNALQKEIKTLKYDLYNKELIIESVTDDVTNCKYVYVLIEEEYDEEEEYCDSDDAYNDDKRTRVTQTEKVKGVFSHEYLANPHRDFNSNIKRIELNKL